jgi:hypothetical protein
MGVGVWAYVSMLLPPTLPYSETQSQVLVHVLEVQVAGNHHDLEVVEQL